MRYGMTHKKIRSIIGFAFALSRKPLFQIKKIRYRIKEGGRNKDQLEIARQKYQFVDNPLVSVRIATYQNSEILIKRAIPSVLNQTYQNFEIIIIGDGCSTDHTERIESWIKMTGDQRIHFMNLEKRGAYPQKPKHRWQVAGTVPFNKGIEIAKGDWIAPLDDDDEFSSDHIESLLRCALSNGLEFAYGIIRMEKPNGDWVNVGDEPLRCGHISHLSVIYHKRLAFFRYDVNAWKYGEPGDWNMWRRMNEAGARIGFLPKVIGTHYIERTGRKDKSENFD